MSSKFECFVEILDKKFEIFIEEKGIVDHHNHHHFPIDIKFSAFYQNVKQCVKIGINEDISFITHKFEVIECMSECVRISVVERADQLIANKSRLLITRKTIFMNPLTPAANVLIPTQLPIIDANGQSNLVEDDYLLRNFNEIVVYYHIVLSINIGWDLKNVYNWDKVYQQMNDWLKPKFDKNNFFCKNVFYFWTHYYSRNFDKNNGKLGPKSQSMFDLLKVIHVLDLDKLYSKEDSIVNSIKNISKRAESVEYQNKYLEDIRIEKLLTIEKENALQINTIPDFFLWKSLIDRALTFPVINPFSTPAVGLPFTRKLFPEEELLIKDKNDIKIYNLIVMAINIGWDLKYGPRSWYKVCQQFEKGYENIITPKTCHLMFYKWTRFYAEVFDKLNGKIDLITQEIFDLLKIVHILDLEKLYSNSNEIYKIIQTISRKQEFNNYFVNHLEDLWLKKINSKEVEEDPTLSQNGDIDLRFSQLSQSTHKYNKHRQQSINSVNKSTNRPSGSSHQRKDQSFTQSKTHNQKSDKYFDGTKDESLIKKSENDIKDFHRIVLATNIGWDFRKCDQNWEKVSQTLNQKHLTQNNCFDLFFFWIKFYAQNYDKMNDKLRPSTQKIFDLLKVVHTLDLYRFLSSSNETTIKIKEISSKPHFKSYFYGYLSLIRDEKIKSKEDHSMDRHKKVSERHLTSYKKLLNYSESKFGTNFKVSIDFPQNTSKQTEKSVNSSHNSDKNEPKTNGISSESHKSSDSSTGSTKLTINWLKRAPNRSKESNIDKRYKKQN